MEKDIHVVVQFVGGVARTRCGDYADADKVTAFKAEATCPKCQPPADKPNYVNRKGLPMSKMSKTGVTVKLVGNDGNAFAVMGATKQAMARAGVSKEIIDAYISEAMSGDYNNLLAVTMEYVDVE